MPSTTPVDPEALRADVREKYREVALQPDGAFHFHTGRKLAALLDYDEDVVDALPDRAVESFAGVGNPFSVRPLVVGERVVDLGSGGGFDCFVAARAVGAEGRVIGVDMTAEMVLKSRQTQEILGQSNVEFREGLLEALPVDDEGGLPLDEWRSLLDAAGFEDLSVSAPVDAFGGSGGETNARAYDVLAYVFLARKPA